jgi:hypothetical protein
MLLHYARVFLEHIVKPRLWDVAFAHSTVQTFSPTKPTTPTHPALAHSTFVHSNFAHFVHSIPLHKFYERASKHCLIACNPASLHQVLCEHIAQGALSSDTLIQQADDAASHRFTFLGDTPLNHACAEMADETLLNWHKDYRSGYSWRSERFQPARTISFLAPHQTPQGFSDVKYPWELNRCQWFMWLALAHVLHYPHYPNGNVADNTSTSNRQALESRWYQAFKRDVLHWIDENPVGCGINWSVGMEIAIRAVSWTCTFALFGSSTLEDAECWLPVLDSLWHHAHYLSYHLEYTRHPGNHFDANVLGLIVLGALFAETRNGKRWIRQGVCHLERELLRQTYADGVNWEHSTAYHRLVTELFLASAIVAERNGYHIQHESRQRLLSMLRFMQAYCRADGTAPAFGDADNGRLLRPFASEDFSNHASTLCCGAVYFQDKSLLPQNAPIATLLDAYLIFGSEAVHQSLTLSSPQSSVLASLHASAPSFGVHHFRDGGMIILHARTAHTQAHCAIDVGDYGMKGWGGHGHNDCLSFVLWLGNSSQADNDTLHLSGREYISDSGTGMYTPRPDIRNALRSVGAHNTLTLYRPDGTIIEPVEWKGLWRIVRDELLPRVHSFEEWSNEEASTLRFVTEHSGYKKRYGFVHRRTFDLVSRPQHGMTLSITDEMLEEPQAKSQQRHEQAFVHLHLPPWVCVEQNDAFSVIIRQRPDNEDENEQETFAQKDSGANNNDTVRLAPYCTVRCTQELMLEEALFSPAYGILQTGLRLKAPCFRQQAVHNKTEQPTTFTIHWQ